MTCSRKNLGQRRKFLQAPLPGDLVKAIQLSKQPRRQNKADYDVRRLAKLFVFKTSESLS